MIIKLNDREEVLIAAASSEQVVRVWVDDMGDLHIYQYKTEADNLREAAKLKEADRIGEELMRLWKESIKDENGNNKD